MNAISIATKHFHAVKADDPISHVFELVHEKGVTFIPVLDSLGKCFGVISARDLMRFHHDKHNPLAIKAWEVCTHKIVEVGPDCPIDELVRVVLDHAIHHLIVAEGRVIHGVISSIDVIRAMHRHSTCSKSESDGEARKPQDNIGNSEL